MFKIQLFKNGFQKFFRRIWEDESGQGATEYILILVVVGVIVVVFKDKIRTIISDKTDDVGMSLGMALSKIKGSDI